MNIAHAFAKYIRQWNHISYEFHKTWYYPYTLIKYEKDVGGKRQLVKTQVNQHIASRLCRNSTSGSILLYTIYFVYWRDSPRQHMAFIHGHNMWKKLQ